MGGTLDWTTPVDTGGHVRKITADCDGGWMGADYRVITLVLEYI